MLEVAPGGVGHSEGLLHRQSGTGVPLHQRSHHQGTEPTPRSATAQGTHVSSRVYHPDGLRRELDGLISRGATERVLC